jgi:hypothetical protein
VAALRYCEIERRGHGTDLAIDGAGLTAAAQTPAPKRDVLATYIFEAKRTQVMSDRHSPVQFRANGMVRNMDAWYEAVQIKPADPLYVPPGERVWVW